MCHLEHWSYRGHWIQMRYNYKEQRSPPAEGYKCSQKGFRLYALLIDSRDIAPLGV